MKIKSAKKRSNCDFGLYMNGEANFDLESKVSNRGLSTIKKLTNVLKKLFKTTPKNS